jgi:cob(I)alamin adenosyltransferase
MNRLQKDDNLQKQVHQKKGLVIVYTGNGKGKTTASMGTLIRAIGQGLKAGVIQFIKSPDRVYGEAIIAKKLGIPFESTGDGFIYTPETNEGAKKLAQAAWDNAKKWISSGNFDLVILDEITYTMSYGWNKVEDVIAWLKANKPADMHIILTGRNAPEELIEYADLVTEMREIKHPFRLQNIPAQKGIDF